MSARSVLWVDLRTSPGKPDLCSSLPKSYKAQRVSRISDILRSVQNWLPWAVCFEYDNPYARGLEALAEIRHRYSSLPIVMLTERHTESLASWALRWRCAWSGSPGERDCSWRSDDSCSGKEICGERRSGSCNVLCGSQLRGKIAFGHRG